jgi:beta-lactam-binding protein with PASTA domain
MAPEPAARKGLDLRHPGGKEYLLAGGIALGLGLLYFWWKNRETPAASTAASPDDSTTAAGTPVSPTGTLLAWFHDHQSSSSATVTVPNVVGRSADTARAVLKAAGLKQTTTNEPAGGFGKDTATVRSQSPPAGTAVKPGSDVDLDYTIRAPAKKG